MSDTAPPTYWVAHARGCNFEQLRKLGFKTFYPLLDDYVFLVVNPKNEKYLRKQTELGISWLKKKGKPVEVTDREMGLMAGETTDRIKVGDEILVVQGYGSNLEGVVLEEDPGGIKIRVMLQGWKKTFDTWIDRMEVVPKGVNEALRTPTSTDED